MIGRRLRAAIRHPVAQSVLALGTVQVALTVVPLITLPYLARVLDRTEFGLVVFVQTFSFLIALIVEYGFTLSATRDVATRRDDPAGLERIVAGVQGAKVLLAGIAIVLGLLLWPVVPAFRQHPDLLAYGVALGILQGFVPGWFFLGVERAQLLALLELSTRIAAVGLIVLFVQGRSDGELVLAIYTLAAAASTVALTLLMLRRVGAKLPTLTGSLDTLRRGRTLFAGTGATAFYTGANAFLLGLIVPAAQVAVFASGEKIVRAGNRVLVLMAQAVYPRASLLQSHGRAERAGRLSVLALLLFGGCALVGAVVLEIFAPTIIRVVFGAPYADAVPLLRIIALILPLNVVGAVLSTQWLLPQGRDRRVTGVLIAACLLNAALVVATTKLAGLTGAAWALVAVELFVVAGNLLGLRKRRAVPQQAA